MFTVQRGQEAELPIVLRDDDDFSVSKIGVYFGSVTLRFRKWNDTAWTTDIIDASNWTEVGDGHYTWRATASDLDTLGLFLYTIQAAGCVQYEGAVTVSATVSGGHVEFE